VTQTVLYDSEQGVATITLNRPERLNTMGGDLIERALEAVERAASDKATRVVILTGAGRGFCAGGDLDAMSRRGAGAGGGDAGAGAGAGAGTGAVARGRDPLMHDANVRLLRGFMRTSQLLMEMGKVTIAAINGACAGAGLALACACDLRFSAAGAKFNVAFRNAGLSGDFGGTWTLPRIVGPAKARELYLMSPRFDAIEAARIGLVSKVLPDAELMPHVTAVAAELASAAPLALALMKQNLNDSLRLSFGELLDREAERHTHAVATDDHIEAAKAFLEKRKPSFKGR
jgi:2-(1,2-epoxy-1,2-dihydrophenyl)acetyl-CoA isomerase